MSERRDSTGRALEVGSRVALVGGGFKGCIAYVIDLDSNELDNLPIDLSREQGGESWLYVSADRLLILQEEDELQASHVFDGLHPTEIVRAVRLALHLNETLGQASEQVGKAGLFVAQHMLDK